MCISYFGKLGSMRLMSVFIIGFFSVFNVMLGPVNLQIWLIVRIPWEASQKNQCTTGLLN